MGAAQWKYITMGVCAAVCIALLVADAVIVHKRFTTKVYRDDLNSAKNGEQRPVDYWL